MLPNPQPRSRWTAFVERWDERLIRFRQCFDPTAPSPDRRMKIGVIVVLSIGLLALAGLISFGVMWIIDHHKWGLVYPMLKMMKLFGLGVVIVSAVLFRDKLSKLPFVERLQGRDAAAPKQ
jgi:hypothetical protein